ncbi:MAG: 5-oxoprolinase subunit PxpB [bacterium]
MIIPRIYNIHDQAITIEFATAISEATNMQVIAMQHAIESSPIKGFIEAVPAYGSLTVYFSEQVSASTVRSWLSDLSAQVSNTSLATEGKQISIPVCYDPSLGTDLAWVAAHLNLSIEDIINLHSSISYRVYMIGFIPGFPYMGILPTALEVPRKQTPSMKIPAGSVAIAGKQTGIYPAEVPGGWQVIGRTPLKMFDPSTTPCSFLNAGDIVQFKPISLETFNQYQ